MLILKKMLIVYLIFKFGHFILCFYFYFATSSESDNHVANISLNAAKHLGNLFGLWNHGKRETSVISQLKLTTKPRKRESQFLTF